MIEHFLNPWMLLGLAGVALPVAVHLARHSHHQRVDWGAMQFLELGRHAQRRARIEQCLLLLVRMLLVGTVVLAMARPWVQFSWLSAAEGTGSRDLVLIIDGSYSMEAQSSGTTAHARALALARQMLDDLKTGDSAALLIARDQPETVITPSTRDRTRVRQALDSLAPPAGSSNIPAALAMAQRLQSRADAPVRQIVVLSDAQAYAWHVDDQTQWAGCDCIRELAAIPSQILAVIVPTAAEKTDNAGIDRLDLFPERTVAGLPVRIRTRIYTSGPTADSPRSVSLEVNGLRIPNKSATVTIGPEGFAYIEMEHRFDAPGSYTLSLVLADDGLAGDNRAAAAISVEDALDVLLVDGAPDPDPARSETYFARTALAPNGKAQSWVRAQVVAWDQLSPDSFHAADVVILANVPRLETTIREALERYAASGGSVIFALGDRVDKTFYNQALFNSGKRLFPTELQDFLPAYSPTATSAGATIAETSLELPWLARFRENRAGGLLDARFSRWWVVSDRTATAAEKPLVIARLTSGDPLLLTRHFGKGTVAVMTSPLDADAGTLPAKLDFVPFLYELIFYAAAHPAERNLWVGQPAVVSIPTAVNPADFAFYDPLGREQTPQVVRRQTHAPADQQPDNNAAATSGAVMQLPATAMPGIYRFDRRVASADASASFVPQFFVADFDRKERDLTPLDAAMRNRLAEMGHIEFLAPEQADAIKLAGENTPFEMSQPLLLACLGLVVLELAVARRLVRAGHVSR